jgi:hypothetical protein
MFACNVTEQKLPHPVERNGKLHSWWIHPLDAPIAPIFVLHYLGSRYSVELAEKYVQLEDPSSARAQRFSLRFSYYVFYHVFSLAAPLY